MAGHLISLYFQEKGYDVTGFARQQSQILSKTVIGDASDMEFISSTLLEGHYDVVINCIGLLNQYAEQNKTAAILLNGYLPHFLADITRETNTRVIHISTDCVFAGNDGPYNENSIPNGVTFYDRTKAIGEIINDKDLTFRTSIVGPDIKLSGIGLFNWFMKQHGTTYGYTGAVWTGVTTYTLVKAMEQALNENLTGLYNLVNNESISKNALLHLFNHYFREDTITILPNEKIKIDKTLCCSRKDFSFIVPGYEQQIKEMRKWVDTHKNLYSHYKLK